MPAVGVGLEDDVGELLGVGRAGPACVIVNWNTWPVGDRRLADLAGGDLHVLLRDGARRRRVAVRLRDGHLLRVEPEPHAVVALAEVGDVADAGQPRQLVVELDRGVVAQVEVVAACRRARTG